MQYQCILLTFLSNKTDFREIFTYNSYFREIFTSYHANCPSYTDYIQNTLVQITRALLYVHKKNKTCITYYCMQLFSLTKGNIIFKLSINININLPSPEQTLPFFIWSKEAFVFILNHNRHIAWYNIFHTSLQY